MLFEAFLTLLARMIAGLVKAIDLGTIEIHSQSGAHVGLAQLVVVGIGPRRPLPGLFCRLYGQGLPIGKFRMSAGQVRRLQDGHRVALYVPVGEGTAIMIAKGQALTVAEGKAPTPEVVGIKPKAEPKARAVRPEARVQSFRVDEGWKRVMAELLSK